MPKLILLILEWSAELPYGALIYFIMKLFLPPRSKKFLPAFMEIFCFCGLSAITIYPEELTGTVTTFIACFLTLILFHRGSLFQKFSAQILIFPILISVSYLTEDMGFLIWLHLFHRNMSQNGEIILHLFTFLLRLPALYGVYRFLKVWIPSAIRDMTRQMWVFIDLISLSSFIGIVTVIYNATILTSYIAYPVCIAALITNLGCCYLCFHMSQTLRTQMQLESYQYQQAYYQELESGQKALRGLRHDMKNHLGIISTFLQQDDPGKAKDYLEHLDHELSKTAKTYCPNSIINAVVGMKEESATKHGISCNIQIDMEASPPIDDIDLCALFSNTLDNAIEACLKIDDVSQRSLSLKVRYKNKNFSYEIKNAKRNEIVKKNGLFETDKKEGALHGIGLSNTNRIVEKYHGEIEIEYGKDWFDLVIFIADPPPSGDSHLCNDKNSNTE